jgi:hypothetical protein
MPIKISNKEINQINTLLAHLVHEVGDLNWISRIFFHSLDVYWAKMGSPKENALRHEGLIGSYMRQIVMGRQFSRILKNSSSSQIPYVSVTIIGFEHFWHPYYDNDLPQGIETFDEPYRKLYSLLKYLSDQMLETANNEEAMKYLASLLGAFALSYPTEYLEADPYFQQYRDNEVQEVSVEDDYIFYLCRMTEYSLFDRFR